MHFLCKRSGIFRLYCGLRGNQDRPEKGINNIRLANTAKRDGNPKVHGLRELL